MSARDVSGLELPARDVSKVTVTNNNEYHNQNRELLSSISANYVFNVSTSLKGEEIIQKLQQSISNGNFTRLLKIKSRLPVSNVTYVFITEINVGSSPTVAPTGLLVLVQSVQGN